jgi:fused signal recognition particle receptor
MNSATQDAMMYLVLFIGILVLAIAVPITISLLKKKKPETEIPQNQSPQAEPQQTKASATVEQNEIPEAKPVTVIPEKEVTVSEALQKTEENFFGRIKKAFSLNSSEKKKVLDEIEEVLYTSDLGPKTVIRLMDKVSEDLSKSEMMDLSKIKNALESEMNLILSPVHESQINSKNVMDLISKSASGPTVLMVVGVNGAGKTTSIGKITAQLASLNQKVLVAAGDTFRAAAGGQLKVWTDRANEKSTESPRENLVEIFWPENTTDPAAVAFDAVSKAKAKNFDYVILDTAGRLHTQSNLMDELKKVKRVMTKVIPEAPHETWIVLDANSGQNALNQAVEFNKALEISGVVLTKMDGTAKGGVALGVVDQLQKPIKLIGIGEKIGDLRLFNQTEYIQSVLGKN